MKKFIGILLALYLLTFLFGDDQVNFPDIYIDETLGTGTGVGSLADPYKDSSEINWTTGGDNSIFDWYAGAEDASVTINLQEGEEWRETLTIGGSGSATYPIIIRSYGSDVKPIINGADVISAWTEAWSAAATTLDYANDAEVGKAFTNWRVRAKSGDLSDSGSGIRITLKAHSADSYTVDNMFLAEQHAVNPYDYKVSPTRVTWVDAGGGNAITVTGGGADEVSDWITFDLDEAKEYVIGFHEDSSVSCPRQTNGWTTYCNDDGTDDSDDMSFNSETIEGRNYFIEKIEVRTGVANTWKATLTTTPEMVFFDESGTITWGDQKGSVGALVNEYDWYYDSGDDLLYVYAATDPDGRYTSVEASERSNCIIMGFGVDHSYITIEDLEIKFAKSNGVWIGSNSGASTGNIVDDCTIHHIGDNGSSKLGDGVEIQGCSSNIVKNCDVFECGRHGIFVTGIYEATDDNIIESNTVYDHWYGAIDILVDPGNPASLDGTIIRYNYIYSSGSGDFPALHVKGNSGTDATNTYLYYNICHDMDDHAIKIDTEVENIYIYNNLVADTDVSTTAGIRLLDTTGVSTIKNNIIYEPQKYAMYIAGSANKTIDNNCSYLPGGFLAYVDGGDVNWANWQGAGFDASGLNVDPKMVDAANNDFRLLMGSPCINAGTDVSLTTDYRGRSIRHAPDIGAYEDPTSALFLTKLFKYLKEKKDGK